MAKVPTETYRDVLFRFLRFLRAVGYSYAAVYDLHRRVSETFTAERIIDFMLTLYIATCV